MRYIRFILLVLSIGAGLSAMAQPSSFAISIDVEDKGICDFEFYKYSTRPSTQQVFLWDGTTLTPYTPGPIRTYRGRIIDHPDYKACAVWYPDGKLYIRATKGKGINDGIDLYDIAIADHTITPLDLPTVDAPMRSLRVLESGFSCTYSDVIDPTSGAGDYETLVAMWENGVNQVDFSCTRDFGLSVTSDLLIIPTDPSIIEVTDIIDPRDYPAEISSLPMFWKTTGNGGRGGKLSYCDAGKSFQGGRSSFRREAMHALPHELGHTLNFGHQHNQIDAMDGNQYWWGRNTKAIGMQHLERTNATCLLNPTPDYTDPVPPYCAEDYYIAEIDQAKSLDVLVNDIDYNGDAVSIVDFESSSLHGGTITQVGDELSYTPAAGFVGRDYFRYTCGSGTGNGYFTNSTKVMVDVRDHCTLALHYTFEETDNTTAHDSGWGITSHNAELKNADFSTNSIAGVVGNALDLPATSDGLVLEDVLDPLDGDLSVSLWFMIHELPTEQDMSMIFDSGSNGKLSKNGLAIMVDSDGLHFQAQTESVDDEGAQIDYTPALSIDQWYHVAMVIDRTTNILRAYVNGEEITFSATDNTDLDPDDIIKGWPGGYKRERHVGDPDKYRSATALGMKTGEDPTDDVFVLNGALDEFKIFTKALSSTEVQELYDDPTDQSIGATNCSPTLSGEPVLLFSDIESGPNSGWSVEQTARGAAVSIWGHGLGESRGSSYVTVNGSIVTAATDYAVWGEYWPTQYQQRITFWLNESMASGPGEITVTVGGVESNALPFTIRPGDIHFITGSNPGGTGSLDEPYGMASYNWVDEMQPGDLYYFRDATVYDGEYNGGNSVLWIRDSEPSGTASMPIALLAFPAETPEYYVPTYEVGHNNALRFSNDYMVFSGFKIDSEWLGADLAGDFHRFIGNDVIGLKDKYGAGTGIIVTGNSATHTGDGIIILGNAIHGGNSQDRFDHGIYLSGCADNGGAEVGWNHLYDNDFGRGPIISINHQDDRCAGTQVLDAHFIFNNIVDCSVQRATAINIHDLSFDEGEIAPEPTYVYNNVFVGCGTYDGEDLTHTGYAPALVHNAAGSGRFYNNTLYNAGYVGFRIRDNVSSSVVKNNIVHMSPDVPGPTGNHYMSIDDGTVVSLSNNFYYGLGEYLPCTDCLQDQNNIDDQDPLFVDAPAHNLRLQDGSPAIGAGTADLPFEVAPPTYAPIERDLEFMIRNATPSVGAYGSSDSSPSACTGDLDANGEVGVSDFLIFNSSYGTTDCDGCPADLNGSGSVDISDFLLFNSLFGTPCQ